LTTIPRTYGIKRNALPRDARHIPAAFQDSAKLMMQSFLQTDSQVRISARRTAAKKQRIGPVTSDLDRGQPIALWRKTQPA
jgi:hypothetical protein